MESSKSLENAVAEIAREMTDTQLHDNIVLLEEHLKIVESTSSSSSSSSSSISSSISSSSSSSSSEGGDRLSEKSVEKILRAIHMDGEKSSAGTIYFRFTHAEYDSKKSLIDTSSDGITWYLWCGEEENSYNTVELESIIETLVGKKILCLAAPNSSISANYVYQFLGNTKKRPHEKVAVESACCKKPKVQINFGGGDGDCNGDSDEDNEEDNDGDDDVGEEEKNFMVEEDDIADLLQKAGLNITDLKLTDENLRKLNLAGQIYLRKLLQDTLGWEILDLQPKNEEVGKKSKEDANTIEATNPKKCDGNPGFNFNTPPSSKRENIVNCNSNSNSSSSTNSMDVQTNAERATPDSVADVLAGYRTSKSMCNSPGRIDMVGMVPDSPVEGADLDSRKVAVKRRTLKQKACNEKALQHFLIGVVLKNRHILGFATKKIVLHLRPCADDTASIILINSDVDSAGNGKGFDDAIRFDSNELNKAFELFVENGFLTRYFTKDDEARFKLKYEYYVIEEDQDNESVALSIQRELSKSVTDFPLLWSILCQSGWQCELSSSTSSGGGIIYYRDRKTKNNKDSKLNQDYFHLADDVIEFLRSDNPLDNLCKSSESKSMGVQKSVQSNRPHFTSLYEYLNQCQDNLKEKEKVIENGKDKEMVFEAWKLDHNRYVEKKNSLSSPEPAGTCNMNVGNSIDKTHEKTSTKVLTEGTGKFLRNANNSHVGSSLGLKHAPAATASTTTTERISDTDPSVLVPSIMVASNSLDASRSISKLDAAKKAQNVAIESVMNMH